MSEFQRVFRYAKEQSRIDFPNLLLVIALLVFLLAVSTISAFGGTVSLPYANHSGYFTSLVLINPSATEVKVPTFWPSYGVGGPAFVLDPFATARGLTWPKLGGGVAQIAIPDGVVAYTEVTDPNGQLARIGSIDALAAGERLQFQDLISSTEFASYLFVSSIDGSTVIVTSYDDGHALGAEEFAIPAGGTVIPKLKDGANRATVSIGSRIGAPNLKKGDVYAFALVSHLPAGEQFAVQGTRF